MEKLSCDKKLKLSRAVNSTTIDWCCCKMVKCNKNTANGKKRKKERKHKATEAKNLKRSAQWIIGQNHFAVCQICFCTDDFFILLSIFPSSSSHFLSCTSIYFSFRILCLFRLRFTTSSSTLTHSCVSVITLQSTSLSRAYTPRKKRKKTVYVDVCIYKIFIHSAECLMGRTQSQNSNERTIPFEQLCNRKNETNDSRFYHLPSLKTHNELSIRT